MAPPLQLAVELVQQDISQAPPLVSHHRYWSVRPACQSDALHAGELQKAYWMCRLATKESHMATNLALDQELLERAFVLSGEPTKKAAVTRALQEFIARREQRRVAELFGKLDWDSSYDYKAERSRQS